MLDMIKVENTTDLIKREGKITGYVDALKADTGTTYEFKRSGSSLALQLRQAGCKVATQKVEAEGDKPAYFRIQATWVPGTVPPVKKERTPEQKAKAKAAADKRRDAKKAEAAKAKAGGAMAAPKNVAPRVAARV